MTLGSPPQSPVAGYYNSPPLHSLSISSPTHQQYQQHHGLYQQQQQVPTPQPQQNQSGYLPGFLMGDPQLQSPATPSSLTPGHSLHSRPGLVSPNKLNRSLSTAPSNQSAPQTPHMRGPQLLKENMNSSLSRTRDKTGGGPPTNSLLFTPNRSISTPGIQHPLKIIKQNIFVLIFKTKAMNLNDSS